MRVGSIARGGTTPRTPRSGHAGLRRRLIGTAVAAGMILSSAAACGGGDDGDSAAEGGGELKGTTIEVAAKWTGPEEENFRKVLDAFQKKTGATVNYASTGENTDAFLGPRIEAGNPPDVAILPQPGPDAAVRREGLDSSRSPDDVVAEVEEELHARTGRSSAPPTARPTAS